jgi:exodeoxyribonuclease-1
MDSIFWHDYETFGADPARDRPAQFAGIRTDLELNIIDHAHTFYCRPFEDYLPAPQACLITGITPQEARSKGDPEAVFAQRVHTLFSHPQTCVAGYNSIRFDDEFSRHLFFRNFYDPYEREYRNGNSRWDLIDVVRMTHALRPEGVRWPVGEDGQVSFRLEKLTAANDIRHEAAHDAMSDVYATIALAKLIRTAQPKLYDYAFSLRRKQVLKERFDFEQMKPFIHVSSKFPASLGCMAVVVPLFVHPTNPNGVVCWDLRVDPAMLVSESPDILRQRLYTPSQALSAGEQRPAFKTIHLNKCPMVAPISMLKTIDPRRLCEWQIDSGTMQRHLDWLLQEREHLAPLVGIFEQQPVQGSEVIDPELTLYSGGFLSDRDRRQLQRVRQARPETLELESFEFEDERLDELLFRYKARNYPESLNEVESRRWVRHCQQRLLCPASGSTRSPLEDYLLELDRLAQQYAGDDRAQSILLELKYHAESIIPFD